MKLIPLAITLVALALIWVFDIPKSLGAHPWWSAKVVWIGGPIGIVIALISGRFAGLWQVMVFAVLTFGAFATARYGKMQFAASYAEDQFAGQLWYFGWIATMAALAALILTLTKMASPKANKEV